MKIFLDTSSVFKLYYREPDSYITENIFKTNIVETIYLSEITLIEFESTVWKKIRTKEINIAQGTSITKPFNNDLGKFTLVNVDNSIINNAKILMDTYGLQGLRTLDSIQLATAVSLKSVASLFVTSDQLLQSFFVQEGLPV